MPQNGGTAPKSFVGTCSVGRSHHRTSRGKPQSDGILIFSGKFFRQADEPQADQLKFGRSFFAKVIMAKTVKGRVGWAVVKKLLKAIPIIGPVFTVGFAGHDIKKKGLVPGAVHIGLDVTPVVGTAKNVIEIVTGDWIPDKESQVEDQSGGRPTFPTKS